MGFPEKYFTAVLRSVRCFSVVALAFLAGSVAASEQSFTQARTDQDSSSQIQPGAVVQDITHGGEGEKAGLQEGDLILGWSRLDHHGKIESPFDLTAVELEEGPLGGVSLDGVRGAERRRWLVGSGSWRVETRPDLGSTVIASYHHLQDLAKAGKASETAKGWSELAANLDGKQPSSVVVWLCLHGAGQLAEAAQWPEADRLYAEAVAHAAEVSPLTRAQVLSAWAGAFRARNDLDNAHKYQALALVENRKVNPGNVTTASTLSELGKIAFNQDDFTTAEDYQQQALAIRNRLMPGSAGVAATLENLGNIAVQRSQLSKAEEYYRQSLAIREKLSPDSRAVSASLLDLALVFEDTGDLDKAAEFLKRGLAIQQKLNPGGYAVSIFLNNLGEVETGRGNLQQAENYEGQAVDIRTKQDPGGPGEAMSLNNLADILQRRGDFNQAEAHQLQALAIQEKINPNSLQVAFTACGLGDIASARGELGQAEKFYRRAFEIRKKLVPETLPVASSLTQLGKVAFLQENLKEAEELYQQALGIQQKVSPHTWNVPATLSRLAEVALESHDWAKAEKYLNDGLARLENESFRNTTFADLLHESGELAWRRSDMAKAEQFYGRALAIRADLIPGTVPHAETLAALARVLYRQQRLEDAAARFEEAINALESQTARLGGSDEVRAGFRAKHAEYYKEYVDLLIRQNQPTLALHVQERLRARTLLETLAAARVDIRKGVDDSLLAQERSLQADISAKSARHLRLLAKEHAKEQVLAVENETKALLAELQEVEGRIRSSSPAYAGLVSPQPLSAREIQEQLLDADTMLLEYSLGDRGSYVFALDSTSLSVHELPKRAEIENAARRLYDQLATRNPAIHGKTEEESAKAADQLSRMILAPLAARIKAAKRLMIVSDGALEYIPFAALSVPGISKEPLSGAHEVVNLPSASTLAQLRRLCIGCAPRTRAVLVLADPVFDASDDRLRSARSQSHLRYSKAEAPASPATSQRISIGRSAQQVGALRGGILPRLLFSRREAAAIYSIATPGDVTEALDFDASKATVTSPQSRNYRIIHIATHGLLNSEQPELSGLVFSMVDRRGQEQDGFLRLLDIYNLDLNADLIVLSACQTALGKQTEGEGMVGLTRGFMYAGTARVVASLWSVSDEATAELMRKFYESVLKRNQTPSQALRSAQMWMRSQKRWKTPYYWAGFVLQGDWK